MTHDQINQKITELTASAFDSGLNLAEIIGAFENVKSEILECYDARIDARLHNELAKNLFEVCWYGDIATVVGLLECTKIATLDGVASAVGTKKELAEVAQQQDGK
jgi:hypothetical protein